MHQIFNAQKLILRAGVALDWVWCLRPSWPSGEPPARLVASPDSHLASWTKLRYWTNVGSYKNMGRALSEKCLRQVWKSLKKALNAFLSTEGLARVFRIFSRSKPPDPSPHAHVWCSSNTLMQPKHLIGRCRPFESARCHHAGKRVVDKQSFWLWTQQVLAVAREQAMAQDGHTLAMINGHFAQDDSCQLLLQMFMVHVTYRSHKKQKHILSLTFWWVEIPDMVGHNS